MMNYDELLFYLLGGALAEKNYDAPFISQMVSPLLRVILQLPLLDQGIEHCQWSSEIRVGTRDCTVKV
jgi:hypothetical protein